MAAIQEAQGRVYDEGRGQRGSRWEGTSLPTLDLASSRHLSRIDCELTDILQCILVHPICIPRHHPP